MANENRFRKDVKSPALYSKAYLIGDEIGSSYA